MNADSGNRLNEQRQLRENKRKEFIQKRRTGILGNGDPLLVGAGNAFPSAVALIPFGDNVDTRVLLKKILDACSDCSIRYSPVGQVGYR